jgi:prolyl-tRNA editing enzyme YbaK/EbsC (Cys-tRNA(Pro) deacylase)
MALSQSLSASAQRVQDALRAKNVACRVVELPASTRSAKEAAEAIGCRVPQIVKSLIFTGKQSGAPILVLASGSNRVNESRLQALVGEPIAKASADFVREKTGFAIGGVPPVGHAEPIAAYIDEDLLQYDEIWAAAGTPHAVFKLTPDDLLKIASGQVAAVT